MASILIKDDAATIILSRFLWTQIKSVVNRELILSAVWLAAALLVVGSFISHTYRDNAERNLRNLLRAELYNVINSVTIGDRGVLVGSPQLGDLRFTKLGTGWDWLVEPIGDFTEKPHVSASIGTSNLPVTSKSVAPFDENYERYYNTNDGFGNSVLVVETEVVLDTGGRSARFRVAGNVAAMNDEVRNFSLILYFALIGFGLSGMIMHAIVRRRHW